MAVVESPRTQGEHSRGKLLRENDFQGLPAGIQCHSRWTLAVMGSQESLQKMERSLDNNAGTGERSFRMELEGTREAPGNRLR